ncbi:MAG: hypothetical protein K5644_10395, partial [Lachnospiraceae bacterium]|nr:hypothetical protein [Lachnospiraceae bacterium]
MRYYGVNMNTDIEEINANSTVKLRDYSWGDSYQGFNAFFSQTLMNDVTFMVYRAEDDGVYAQFSYDETKYSYEDVHDHIFGTLNEKFKVQKFNKNPKEISMWDFMDNMNEGRRRDYINNWNRLADIAGLWVFDHFGFYASQRQREMPFDFSEMIISTNCDIEDGLYDKSLLSELDNIETHKNESGLDVNMVHYAISSRSTEATKDMMRVLMNRLYDANRISTRRVDIVSNVKPQMRDSLFFFDLIVENNYGGVVVFDLSEKFGYDSVEYGGIAKYIAGLVKKHRNKCLFVFTYNIDNPGFAYDILSQVQDFVITMPLKEGTGDR